MPSSSSPPPTRATATTAVATAVVFSRMPGRGPRLGARSAAIGPKAVADAAHGLDALAPEGPVDLAPQVPDVDLDDVGVAFEREVPYLVEQLLLRHGLAGPAQQLLQHRELAGRELDIDVSPAAPVRPRVQDEVAGGERRRVVGAAPGEGSKAGNEHGKRERL